MVKSALSNAVSLNQTCAAHRLDLLYRGLATGGSNPWQCERTKRQKLYDRPFESLGVLTKRQTKNDIN